MIDYIDFLCTTDGPACSCGTKRSGFHYHCFRPGAPDHDPGVEPHLTRKDAWECSILWSLSQGVEAIRQLREAYVEQHKPKTQHEPPRWPFDRKPYQPGIIFEQPNIMGLQRVPALEAQIKSLQDELTESLAEKAALSIKLAELREALEAITQKIPPT